MANYDSGDIFNLIAWSATGGAMILGFILAFTGQFDYKITHDTLIDICHNLAPNETIVDAQVSNEGKLLCIKPTFDHTANIIIKEIDKK